MSTMPREDLHWDRAVYSGAMQKRLRPLMFVILVIVLALFSARPASAQAGLEDESEKIRTIIKQYEKSVSDADTTLASQIWSLTADVTFIHPGGHEHGWEEIKRNLYEKLMRDLFSERKLSASDISIHVYKDAAWAEFNWVFVAKLRSDGSPVRTEGRETQVYQKTERGWRIVHVHYSGMLAAPKS